MRSAKRCAASSSATPRARAQVVEDDKKLDALEIETERRAVQLIALRAPMAGDLRDVVAALKISGVVERIGDYAKNIAKRVPLLENAGKIEPLSLLPEMARIATGMVHDVLDAFVERDAEAAVRVCERDDAVDDFYDSIFRTLLTHMMENPHNIGQSAHLLFVAKNLERVGDHATNIAEMVYYAATGEHMADRPGKSPKLMMANKRLLLVEDDRALAELVTFHFERAGYDVTRTGDGEEALILVDEVKPDVILLDWMIEGISGIEVCRRLRRRPTTANVPIIMLTARGEEERPHPRLRDRRRRLCDQAVQPARAGRPGRRRAAPRAPGAGRRAARLCRHRDGRRRAPRSPRRRSRCRSARPSSACSGISSSIPAASSRASGCSMRSGRTMRTSTCARSTCTSAGCARRSMRAAGKT